MACRVFFSVLIATFGLYLVGCGDSNSESASSNTGAAGAAARHLFESAKKRHDLTTEQKQLIEPLEPRSCVPSTPPKKTYKIMVALAGTEQTFDQGLTKGLTDAAAKDKLDVQIQSANGDAGRQASEVSAFAAQKPDAIIVYPVQAVVKASDYRAACQVCPVFVLDRTLESSPNLFTVASSNVGGATQVGMFIEGAIFKKSPGSVAMLENPDDLGHKQRIESLKNFFTRFRKTTVAGEVPANPANASTAAASLVSKYPSADVIFAADDVLGSAALAAVQAAKSPSVVIAFGGDSVAKKQIGAQTQWCADVLEFPHLIGLMAVDIAFKKLNGEDVSTATAVPVNLASALSFR